MRRRWCCNQHRISPEIADSAEANLVTPACLLSHRRRRCRGHKPLTILRVDAPRYYPRASAQSAHNLAQKFVSIFPPHFVVATIVEIVLNVNNHFANNHFIRGGKRHECRYCALDHGAGFCSLSFCPIYGNWWRARASICRVFAIFGHGNVTCLGGALEHVQDQLPTWRGQNEQSMALAAVAYAKAKKRRQIMIATSSVGPGATNMVTAAAVAHANRLPVLLIAGDTYVNRLPDPVLQQVEHFGAPSTTVNDSFKAVSRYWDRIVHPAQIIQSLPQAVAMMLDPADCGPAFIAIPQDTQELAYDYPLEFFERKTWVIRAPAPHLNR